ncbi:MAG: hypothetical protein M3O30_00365 [Planctomycetota bacterium]|nr:hypothetical protein [Planctomycetota bacterium]
MNRTETISWAISVCAAYVRLSQAKTLGILVASPMRNQRISLANLGRQMNGAVKHHIKRPWRFCANDRIETSDAMRGVRMGPFPRTLWCAGRRTCRSNAMSAGSS